LWSDAAWPSKTSSVRRRRRRRRRVTARRRRAGSTRIRRPPRSARWRRHRLGDVARTDAINDHQRFPQLRKLLAGGQCVASAWRQASGAFEIDPNACSVWRLRVQSAALTLTFKALEALPDGLTGSLWANAVRVATVEIILDWQAAASGDRTLTLANVRFTDATAPTWTAGGRPRPPDRPGVLGRRSVRDRGRSQPGSAVAKCPSPDPTSPSSPAPAASAAR
jgi:hypothetical protein